MPCLPSQPTYFAFANATHFPLPVPLAIFAQPLHTVSFYAFNPLLITRSHLLVSIDRLGVIPRVTRQRDLGALGKLSGCGARCLRAVAIAQTVDLDGRADGGALLHIRGRGGENERGDEEDGEGGELHGG